MFPCSPWVDVVLREGADVSCLVSHPTPFLYVGGATVCRAGPVGHRGATAAHREAEVSRAGYGYQAVHAGMKHPHPIKKDVLFKRVVPKYWRSSLAMCRLREGLRLPLSH